MKSCNAEKTRPGSPIDDTPSPCKLHHLKGFPSKKITVDAGGYRSWPEYTVSQVRSMHIYFLH